MLNQGSDDSMPLSVAIGPLVEKYIGIRLDVDFSKVSRRGILVVETSLRLHREESFSYIRAIWYLRLMDGRCVISVPPGVGQVIMKLLNRTGNERFVESLLAVKSLKNVNQALMEAGLSGINRSYSDFIFTCGSDNVITDLLGDCRRLIDAGIPPANYPPHIRDFTPPWS